MILLQKIIGLSLILQIFSCQAFFDPFFDDFLEEQENMIKQLRGSFAQQSKGTDIYASIKENTQEKKVILSIKGITGNSCEAHLNGNTLTITTPDEKITLQTKNKFLSVQVVKEEFIKSSEPTKNDEKTENNSEKSSEKSRVKIGQRIIQTAKTVQLPLDLEKQTIEYNKAEKTLTIIILQYDEKKIGKSLPVTMVNELDSNLNIPEPIASK